MKVNVIHSDLNPCGGAEQVALATMGALLDMDLQVDLTVATPPDIPRIRSIFGAKRTESIFSRMNDIKPLGKLPLSESDDPVSAISGYDLTVNTHGDCLPYYGTSLTKANSITYCHYPVTVELVTQRERGYLDRLVDLGLVDQSGADKPYIWSRLLDRFFLMLDNSLVLTNSNFSRDAIQRAVASYDKPLKNAINPTVIPPAVNAEEYRKAALSSTERSDSVLVVSRIHPFKEIENAVLLARILKGKGINASMTIVGNVVRDSCSIEYLHRIEAMIQEFELSEGVKIILDAPMETLKSLMKKAKVYFHPMRAEPFGISVVEAMSAGLVPVTPDTGGHTDFVPRQYAFRSLDQAAEIVSLAFNATEEDRTDISDLASEFSSANYAGRFQSIVKGPLVSGRVLSEMPAIEKSKPGYVSGAA